VIVEFPPLFILISCVDLQVFLNFWIIYTMTMLINEYNYSKIIEN